MCGESYHGVRETFQGIDKQEARQCALQKHRLPESGYYAEADTPIEYRPAPPIGREGDVRNGEEIHPTDKVHKLILEFA